jgi:glycogen operon protein
LLDFTRSLTRLRQSHPVFRRRRFFQGRPIHGTGVKDLHWIKPDGTEMSDLDWQAGHVACLGMVLPGNQIDETNDQGARIRDESFAILFNAHHETVPFRLGTEKYHLRWSCELDTTFPHSPPRHFNPMSVFPLQPRSLVILRAEPLPPAEGVSFH